MKKVRLSINIWFWKAYCYDITWFYYAFAVNGGSRDSHRRLALSRPCSYIYLLCHCMHLLWRVRPNSSSWTHHEAVDAFWTELLFTGILSAPLNPCPGAIQAKPTGGRQGTIWINPLHRLYTALPLHKPCLQEYKCRVSLTSDVSQQQVPTAGLLM